MSYINQAPRELSKQSAAFKKKHPTFDTLPAGYTMQPKYDGCHLIVHIQDNGEARALSRTGEPCRSVDHIVEQAKRAFGPGWVVFGEAYCFGKTFSQLSGLFRQHANAPELMYIVFDAVPATAFENGLYHPTPYRERLERLRDTVQDCAAARDIVATPDFPVDNPEEYAQTLRSWGGYDGAILRNSDSGWQAGDSKHGEVIKVKPVMSLDLRVRGWFIGKGKHAARAGGIYVEHNGVSTGVGTGFTDDERTQIAKGLCDNGIAEVEFMGFTEGGALREPRFKGWRYDKHKAD